MVIPLTSRACACVCPGRDGEGRELVVAPDATMIAWLLEPPVVNPAIYDWAAQPSFRSYLLPSHLDPFLGPARG